MTRHQVIAEDIKWFEYTRGPISEMTEWERAFHVAMVRELTTGEACKVPFPVLSGNNGFEAAQRAWTRYQATH